MATLESCNIPAFGWDYDVYTSDFDLEGECSAWKWCPCDDNNDWAYCERPAGEDECDMQNVTNADCTGDGGWIHLCGNPDLGPPCVKGRFYGEVVLICYCPTTESASFDFDWSLSEETSSYSCPDDTPLPPFPFLIPYSNITDPGHYVPQIMFDEPLGPGARSMWTWCPCKMESEVYPSMQSPSCPYDPDCFDAEGPGQWVHRGGPHQLGPPPIDGRFYGETVAVGWCCGSESSESLSYISMVQSLSSCSAPWNPAYDWQIRLDEFAGDIATDNIGCVVDCSGWLWCECLDPGEKCKQEYDTPAGECPFNYGPATFDPGGWQLIEGADHHGAPPVQGRFYGEIVWYCECPILESSSSSFAGGACDTGGVEISGSMTPDVTGYYNIGGWFNGQTYYVSDDGWYVVYDDDPFSPEWRLQADPPGSSPTGDYWILSVSDWDPPTGEYQPFGGATGTATLTCCVDCAATCIECPGTIEVTISGLSGDACSGMNGTWYVDNLGTSCYYEGEFFPSTCVTMNIHIICQCNAWTVWIAGNSCGPGLDKEPGWTSEPRPPAAGTVCPPYGTYIMHITDDDCSPSGQIPTVSLALV